MNMIHVRVFVTYSDKVRRKCPEGNHRQRDGQTDNNVQNSLSITTRHQLWLHIGLHWSYRQNLSYGPQPLWETGKSHNPIVTKSYYDNCLTRQDSGCVGEGRRWTPSESPQWRMTHSAIGLSGPRWKKDFKDNRKVLTPNHSAFTELFHNYDSVKSVILYWKLDYINFFFFCNYLITHLEISLTFMLPFSFL